MNNLILTGFITAYSGLKEAMSDNYGKYNYMDLELRTDEATPQTPIIHLTGALAVQLSTCQLTPQTMLRIHFRIFSHDYATHDGEQRKYNDLTVWKIDVLDAEEKVIFTCRK